MTEEIKFDANGKPIHVNIKTGGKVLISYTFKFWSSTAEGEKKLFEKPGDNASLDDDCFKVINQNDLNEPLANYHNRTLHTGGTVQATDIESQPYTVTMEIFQCDSVDQINDSNKIGEAKCNGDISTSQGMTPIPAVMAQLIKL